MNQPKKPFFTLIRNLPELIMKVLKMQTRNGVDDDVSPLLISQIHPKKS